MDRTEHQPFLKFKVIRYALTPSSKVVCDGKPIAKALPQASWKLEPLSTVHPEGLVRIEISAKDTKEPFTGRIDFFCAESEPFRQLVWFASDEKGVVVANAHVPFGIAELYLTIYSADATSVEPTVTIKEMGRLQKYLPLIYDLVRYHVRHPAVIVSKFFKVYFLLMRGDRTALKEKALRNNQYLSWIAQHDTITKRKRNKMRQQIAQLSYKPCISILLPVYDVSETYLRLAIESVINQLYPYWQLCIADDCSSNGVIREIIKEYAKRDPRITFTFRSSNGHISKATNSAAELATGEFFAFLDHDDELREHALYSVALELQTYPEAELIFSDEDRISPEGLSCAPYFKSDWNPELVLSHNYVCHLMVVRAQSFKRLGGLRSECDGAQDWDLVLRIAEQTTRDKIRHIPRVLYHWRMIEGSTAKEAGAKPYVTDAQVRAVSEHLSRRGDPTAWVEPIPEISMLRVHYAVPQPAPLVTLLVNASGSEQTIRRCVDGILNVTAYRNIELVVAHRVSNGFKDRISLADLPERDCRVQVVEVCGSDSFPKIANQIAQQASGSIIGFVDSDIQVVDPDWLDEMVGQIFVKDVAAVGARLIFTNGTIKHAGLIIGIDGIAAPQFATHPMHSLGYFCRAVLPQNLSAVTSACMLVHLDLFRAVGGFDDKYLGTAWYDVDLCLKLRESGRLIIYTPYAELLHHQLVSQYHKEKAWRSSFCKHEHKVMQERWGLKLCSDPFYNPNLSRRGVNNKPCASDF